MVDFIEASPLMYALTVKPTIYVSHIRQFWSIARIETTEEGTQILATVDGIHITITESSLRRNLKLKDEEGISSLPNTELFDNLTLMGYNISPNQKFTFQKGQFFHQWKYLIYTIMQCLSPKVTGFNEFSSNIASALVFLATNRTYNFSKMIFDGLVKNINNKSSAFPTVSDEPKSPLRDISQGEACPTDSGFIADQNKATIAKSSTLPYDSAPRVTSPATAEGSMQQTINELTALCTTLQRQYSELAVKFEAQGIEITRLKARLKLLEDRQGVAAEGSGDDAPIKGRSLDEGEAAAERTSDDTEEMATVLTFMDAATVLASGAAEVPTVSGSIPTAGPSAAEVPTGSYVVPTASPVLPLPLWSAQIARDAEIARIHVEEELQIMIDGLDRNNETVAKYLQEYHQFTSELPIERRIELISNMVKYQDNYTKVKDFRGMTFEEVEAKFNSFWKQMEDFIPMGLKEKAERIKRKEKVKEMMQLVPIKEVYVEALQVKHPIIDWKVELSRLYEPDDEDQLWTHTQNFMHAPVEWKLYDSCGVHHVTSKDKEIFMLVEKDYPLGKGLALVMINYKLQVENYSQMANELILKIYKIANSPRQLDAAHTIAASKVPMLKPGEFELWRMRIEQYIQMMDYALWDVIENENSILKTQIVNNVETVIPPTTAEEKLQRRNEVKARSTLIMGLPNEHQLKFNSFKDVKSLLEAIEKRLGGNDATKRLKETFSNSSMRISLNQALKVLITHLISFRSFMEKKPDLDTLSMDDFYNNLKVNAASLLNIDNLSEAVICAFLASQPNSTHHVNEDLEQIHPDDLEEMDLKWQMAMLTMRARRFLKNRRRKLNLNRNDSVAFDKTKVECYNYHKRGHFARKCRALRRHDNRSRDVTKKTVPVETPNSLALVSCDGLGGYDWSD
nr:hypothetical protein [Tanacetum cinerariifolium]